MDFVIHLAFEAELANGISYKIVIIAASFILSFLQIEPKKYIRISFWYFIFNVLTTNLKNVGFYGDLYVVEDEGAKQRLSGLFQ